jgi:hypothetical protein
LVLTQRAPFVAAPVFFQERQSSTESINSSVKLRRVARQSRTAQAVAMFWSAGHGQCQENLVAARIILGAILFT